MVFFFVCRVPCRVLTAVDGELIIAPLQISSRIDQSIYFILPKNIVYSIYDVGT